MAEAGESSSAQPQCRDMAAGMRVWDFPAEAHHAHRVEEFLGSSIDSGVKYRPHLTSAALMPMGFDDGVRRCLLGNLFLVVGFLHCLKNLEHIFAIIARAVQVRAPRLCQHLST